MNRYNLYVDGSWLFKLCDADKILSRRTEEREKPFPLDFLKLTRYVEKQIASAFGSAEVRPVTRYIYTSIFNLDGAHAIDQKLRRNVETRGSFVKSAEEAGFSSEGIIRVPFKPWMGAKLKAGLYREKLVDTSLVARLVEQAISDHGDDLVHVVLAGDVDMLAGIRIVVPDYSQKVVLVTTHPEAFAKDEQASSFDLAMFSFAHGPFFLEKAVEDIIKGRHVYSCSNPDCHRVFSRTEPLPKQTNPFCLGCAKKRGRGRRLAGSTAL